MNLDYLTFNEIYRAKIENAGGIFVDVWDGFTNAEGKFVSAGPNVNGQIVRLRGKKGINMTRAGQAKLAFFTDKALRKLGLIENYTETDFAALGTINRSAAQPITQAYDPVGTRTTIILPLGSAALDGGETLDGENNSDDPTAAETNQLEVAAKKETSYKTPIGRIDSDWGATTLAQ